MQRKYLIENEATGIIILDEFTRPPARFFHSTIMYVLAFTSILDAFLAKTLANPAGITLTASAGKYFAGFAMIRKKDSVEMNSRV